MEKNSTRLSTTNARSWKIRTRISGGSVPSSTRTNTARIIRPPTMQSQVAGLRQPQLDACSNPSTDKAMPTVTSTAPVQSIRSLRRIRGIFAITMSTRARTAIGMLIQKIARQVHWVR